MSQKSYHDYVIKDGQFIGRFEEMYQDCADPWMQSQQPNKFSRMATILFMKQFGIKSLLECGCGLGYFADWIHRETGIVPKSVDISATSIEKARSLFPHLDFEVSDITKELEKFKDNDAVLLSEIIWYILPDLDGLFEVMRDHFQGKYLLVNQVFYKGSQKYGTEYFTNMQEFIGYVPFPCAGRCEATLEQDSTIETATIFRIS